MNKRLFHISFKDDLPSIIDPKRNDGIYEGEEGYQQEAYPEPSFPRFSCSPTIIQCFQAVYPNVKRFFDEDRVPYLDFFVYSPVIDNELEILTPEDLTKKRFVHDAFLTEEYCILSRVRIEKVAKIRINRIAVVEKIWYRPFNDPSEKKDSWLPGGFSFKVLQRFKRDIVLESISSPIFLKW
mgnify:CR=1 FL=1